MDAQDYLFYGFGQVVYSIALSDGKVQKEEFDLLKEKIREGTRNQKVDYGFTDIVFQLLEKQHVFTAEESYASGIKNMKLGGHKMTPELKEAFVNIASHVAASFPPVTIEEESIVNKFKIDITEVH